MADHQRYHFLLFLLISSCFVLSSYAYQFNVGGQQGWVVNPMENYTDWSARLRFQVNDTLFFKYSKGDSVLVVNKDDYDKCNTDKPIMKFDNGNSIFKFDRSGPFYFITGNKDNCEKGQKITIVVLAVRNYSPLPSPPGQSPMASPPTGPLPISPSPSGGITTPSVAPAPALSPSSASPTAKPPTSPSPAAQTPVPSAEELTPAPAVTPVSSSPLSSPPLPFSPSTTPGSPELSPSGGGSSIGAPTPGNTPSDIHSPTGSPSGSSATPAFTPSAVLFSSTVSFVLCGLVISI